MLPLIIWRHNIGIILLWTCGNKSYTQYFIHIKITIYIKIMANIKIILILENTCFGPTFFANYLDVWIGAKLGLVPYFTTTITFNWVLPSASMGHMTCFSTKETRWLVLPCGLHPWSG